MNTTPETIEDEVLRDIEKPENPYKRYRVEFPFTCTFTIPEDGHNTRVTIETRSEHLHHAKSEDDVRLQLEKDREIDGPLNAKRILEVRSRWNVWNVEPRECPSHIIRLHHRTCDTREGAGDSRGIPR